MNFWLVHSPVHLTECSLHIQAGGRLGLDRTIQQLVEWITTRRSPFQICAMVSHTP
jgi:hypothetical protein